MSDHRHTHDHGQAHGKDPVEQEKLVKECGDELKALFVDYVQGKIDFAELSFATFDVLSDVHSVATGDYELIAPDDVDDDEWDEDDEENDGYDEADHTREQEDLSGEPAR